MEHSQMVARYVSDDGFNPRCQNRFLAWMPSRHPKRTTDVALNSECRTCLIPKNPTISLGRWAVAEDDGSHGAYLQGFLGDPVEEGAFVIAAIADDSSSDAVIAGGSAWTRAPGGAIAVGSKSGQLWYKFAGASEPAAYTITSSGNGSCVSLLEVFGINSVNPIDLITGSMTATAPTAISPDIDSLAVIVAIDLIASTGFTPPTGYAAQGFATCSFSNLLANIATNEDCGSGSISPGNWGSPELTASYLWTMILQPT